MLKTISISLAVIVTATAAHAKDIWVSPSGSDRNAGARTRPLASLDKAIYKARTHPGSTVHLLPGQYPRTKPLVLTSRDNGLTIQGATHQPSQILGGRKVRGFQPVTDPDLIKRFHPRAKKYILQLDLKKLGITDCGARRVYGFGHDIHSRPLEVFFNGNPLTPARWPNSQWLNIKSVPDHQNGVSFTYAGDNPKSWRDKSDIWVNGYWKHDWAYTVEKIQSINTTNREITIAAPGSAYGYKVGQRFYFQNILEELDSPGEYFVNSREGLLYLWPPSDIRKAEVMVSLMSSPVIQLTNASHVTIKNLVVEASRGCGVEIRGGKNNLIENCTLRNLGTLAISVGQMRPDIHAALYADTTFSGDAGTCNGVRGCHIYNTGDGGILLGGGNRKQLIKGENFVEDCEIHHFQRLSRTYRPAVAPYGCGQRISRNHLHDAPHTAILAVGNEHLVELNDIHTVCMETNDAGAFYMGRDLSMRGNIVRCNYFHDLGSSIAVQAVYLDDLASGTLVEDNLFVNAGRAIQLGGGRDNIIRRNVFADNRLAILIDARGKSWAKFYFNGQDDLLRKRLEAVNYNRPPYSTAYPQLSTILQDDPAFPKGTKIVDNLLISGRWIEWLDGLSEKVVETTGNSLPENRPRSVVDWQALLRPACGNHWASVSLNH